MKLGESAGNTLSKTIFIIHADVSANVLRELPHGLEATHFPENAFRKIASSHVVVRKLHAIECNSLWLTSNLLLQRKGDLEKEKERWNWSKPGMRMEIIVVGNHIRENGMGARSCQIFNKNDYWASLANTFGRKGPRTVLLWRDWLIRISEYQHSQIFPNQLMNIYESLWSKYDLEKHF